MTDTAALSWHDSQTWQPCCWRDSLAKQLVYAMWQNLTKSSAGEVETSDSILLKSLKWIFPICRQVCTVWSEFVLNEVKTSTFWICLVLKSGTSIFPLKFEGRLIYSTQWRCFIVWLALGFCTLARISYPPVLGEGGGGLPPSENSILAPSYAPSLHLFQPHFAVFFFLLCRELIRNYWIWLVLWGSLIL